MTTNADIEEQNQVTEDPKDDISIKTSDGVEMLLVGEDDQPSCCSRFRGEWSLNFFQLSETNGCTHIIDVQGSFAPLPFCRTFIVKAVIFGWILFILVEEMLASDPVAYYFIFLSSWSLLAAVLYLTTSFINTLLGVGEQRSYEDSPNFLVRLAWGLYPTAATSQLTATIFFWTLEHKPGDPVTYIDVMKGGVIALLVILEGRVVNRIPVRVKHLVFPMSFALLFVIWSVIQSYTNIGNPYSKNMEADDDAIYPSLNWNKRLKDSIATSAILVAALTPFLFLNVWLISIWSFPFHFNGSNRKYYYLQEKERGNSCWESIFG